MPFARATFLVGVFLCLAPIAGAQAPSVKIRYLDVDQGHATLVIGPTGKTCLIDAGDVGKGNAVIGPQLAALGVTTLDVSVATHWHSDHYGSFIELKNAWGFWPTTAYDRGLDPALTGQFLYNQYHAAMGIHRATLVLGTTIDLGGGATLQCVAVNGQPLGGSAVNLTGTAQIENNRSIVLKLTYGDFHAVIGGDLQGGFNGTADVETSTAAAVGDVDVYLVHHHGSITSTNNFFLATIKPEVSVISCGDSNPYGHPHATVVNALLAAPHTAALYRLNTCDASTLTPGNPVQQVVGGTLLIETDGAVYTISGPGIATVVRTVDEGVVSQVFEPLDVVISEFLPNPRGPGSAPLQDIDAEWVELRNNLPSPVNLLGFTLRGAAAGTDSFVFPSVTIPPFGHVIVGRSANIALNGGLVFDYVAPANKLVLANASDVIELLAPNGAQIDFVAYGTGTPLPVPNGFSYERKNARAPAYASNFVQATCCYWPTSATPCVCSGTSTEQNFGTPRALNGADQTPNHAYFSRIGAAAPGSTFTLNLAVFGSAGKPYFMAASGGTGPPFVLSDGRAIHLADDSLMLFSLTPGNGVFFNLIGTTNVFGSAQASVTLPNLPSLSGIGFYAGGLVLDPAYVDGVGAISDPLHIAIQ